MLLVCYLYIQKTRTKPKIQTPTTPPPPPPKKINNIIKWYQLSAITNKWWEMWHVWVTYMYPQSSLSLGGQTISQGMAKSKHEELSVSSHPSVSGAWEASVTIMCSTVAKSESFWRAAGQSNLADKQLATTKASKVWFSCSHNCTLANGAVFHFVCHVWLSSGPPEYFTFSYCAWLWNGLSQTIAGNCSDKGLRPNTWNVSQHILHGFQHISLLLIQ